MIDVHCHILPDVDDGSECMQESINMAMIAKELVKYDGKVDEYMGKITKLNTDANFWEVFTPEEDERYIRNTIKRESEKKVEK